MNPTNRAAFLQQRQITPHRLSRHTQTPDQFIGADRMRGVDRLDDRRVPLNGKHQ